MVTTMTDLIQSSRDLEAIDLDSDDSGDSSGHSGRTSLRGPIITISIVLVLVVATGLTVLGLGVTDTNITNFDASSWLYSSGRGEVDHVNGVTAKVDTRARIKDAQNHEIEVTQTDKYVILRDLSTGQVSTLDLTTLQTSAATPTTPGLGVSVALYGETAFVIDSIQGQVRQLDPRTLAPVGDSIALPNGIAPAGFDGKGTLWIAVPTEGTVVGITPGTNGAGPRVTQTVAVADPGHDLVATAMDSGVAVLDNTDQKLETVEGGKVVSAPVPVNAPGSLPSRTDGADVPVTDGVDRQVVVVNGSDDVTTFTVPGAGELTPAVAFAGHFYCADSAAGIVYEFDGHGKLVNQIKVNPAGGTIQLEVREDRLFINAPDGSTAVVVDQNHVARSVDKYQNGVLGGDPPPAPNVPPAKAPPPKGKPGKPQNVTAFASDATVRLAWREADDNGSPIIKYVVTGGPTDVAVGANQRTAVVRGLSNGKTYVFQVYAVNAIGNGPSAQSPPVMPTADVPFAPTSVTATANPNGTVDVTWPAAAGGGRKIIRYTVTAVTSGAQAPIGDVTDTRLTVPAGNLDYGTQVAFTVVAINDRGAGSASSPASNTVVPFTRPGAPRSLSASTAGNQKGAVTVTWRAAQDNGRPIEKYVVEAGGSSQDVTGTTATVTGFPDDTAVTVTVHAVNAAGDGPTATASARTIGAPTMTVTGSTGSFNSISVTFTPNSKGGDATCKVQIGSAAAQSACSTQPVTLTVGGLWPNGTYNYTASVTTAAGTVSAAGSRATSQLKATVICTDPSYCGSGIWVYSVPSQADGTLALGTLVGGNQFTPQCHIISDPPVNAKPWGGRSTNEWLRLTFKGKTGYFPDGWVNTDGGNNLSLLPSC
jgi:hypothetical protein